MSKNRKLNKFRQKFYSKYSVNIQILKLLEYPNVLVKSKYGTHKVNRVSLLSGNMPTIQTAVNKFDYLKNQVSEKHNNKYFYSNFEYKNQRQKIEIICPIHGKFIQEIRFHLSGNGCKRCQYAKQKIDKSFTTPIFIEKANKIHNNFYDYSKSNYINTRTEVIIICPLHGSFKQIASEHLKGHGCFKCGLINKSELMKESPVGWTLTNWSQASEKSKNFDSFKVYIIECWDENESFYKIGRTFTKTKIRIKNNGKFPYKFKVIQEFKGKASFIFKFENFLKKLHKRFTYLPKKYFVGHKECFSKIIVNMKITNRNQIVPGITIKNLETGNEVYIDEGFSGEETIKNPIFNLECYEEKLEIIPNSIEKSQIIGILHKLNN